MKRVHLGLSLLIATITLQVTWYAMLMVSYVRTPGKLEGADFLFYYSVGHVAHEHSLVEVYNLNLESAAQAEVTHQNVGDQEFFLPNHPPFLYPVALFFSTMDYRQAYLCFAAFLFFY
jgi:hypothetical protein